MDDVQVRSKGKPSSGWAGFLIGPVFLLIAAWFLWGPSLTDIPETKAVTFDKASLSTAARRAILGDPPRIIINGFERTCQDCHALFPAPAETPAKLQQHGHVVLNHGINNRCRNCHDVKDRDRLVLRDGHSITYSQSVELCAQCHGPTYRDWERGMHGRTNGYWDSTRGRMVRLQCIECHDPHEPRVPAMDPMKPLPGPNTLRMPHVDEHSVVKPYERDPLRRALTPSAQSREDAEGQHPVEESH